jgi:multiple sugar transport system substrate-binding protein
MASKLIAPAAAIAAVALALTGCSSGSSGDTGKVTVTYSNFISNGGNEKNLERIIDAFEQEHPDITIKVNTLPYSDYFTALQTDLAGGTEADVFDIEYANYQSYVDNGVLAALDGVTSADYKPSLLESYQTDGTQYALPSSFSTVVLFFNKDLFDAAGVSYPTADWTWADEQAAAEKLTNSGAGVFGDYQPISYNEFTKTVAQAGGSFLSKDGNSVAFNSPEGLAAANWLVGKSGTTMPTVEQGAGTPDFDSGLFGDGKLAMWHTGIWMFGNYADAPFGWDIAVEPNDTTEASAVFSNAVAVSANSGQKQAAQEWAEYLTSSSTMVETRLDAGWELPPIADESLLSSYLDQGAPANRKAVFESLDAIAPAPSIGDKQAKMQDIVTEQLTEAAAGRITVQQALATAEEQVNALLKG